MDTKSPGHVIWRFLSRFREAVTIVHDLECYTLTLAFTVSWSIDDCLGCIRDIVPVNQQC